MRCLLGMHRFRVSSEMTKWLTWTETCARCGRRTQKDCGAATLVLLAQALHENAENRARLR